MDRDTLLEKIPLKSQIQVTTYETDEGMDDRAKQLAAAEQLPGMADAIDARLATILENLMASYAAGKISPTEFVTRCQRAQHSARMIECRAAINAGRVAGVRPVSCDLGDNLILRNFFEDLFARFVDGNSAGTNQTLQIKYLALGLSYAASSFTQADLFNEFFRKELDPADVYDDGLSTFYASLYLTKSEGNPTGNTTVSSATSNTITLTDATGFATNCRAQIQTANNTYNCTISLSGSVATCSAITGGSLNNASAFDSADIPQAGDTVIVLIAEGGFIIGDDATDTLNTGKPLNRRRLETLKTTANSKALDYILTAASLET